MKSRAETSLVIKIPNLFIFRKLKLKIIHHRLKATVKTFRRRALQFDKINVLTFWRDLRIIILHDRIVIRFAVQFRECYIFAKLESDLVAIREFRPQLLELIQLIYVA